MKKVSEVSKDKIKRAVLNMTVLLISLSLVLIVSESISRAVYNSPSFIIKFNKDVHEIGADYILSKNARLVYEGNYIDNKYLNPSGYKELLKKDSNIFRVLLLGDSVAASFIEGREQYFSDRLEESLNNYSRVNVQVVNTAVGGYNIIQEAEYFEKEGLKFKPNLIILLFCTNDFDQLSGAVKEKDGTTKLISYRREVPFLVNSTFSKFLVKNSYFYRFLNKQVINIMNRNNRLKVYYYFPVEEANKTALKRIIQLSKENGITFLLVMSPRLQDFKNYTMIELHNEVKGICQENDAHFLDLLDSFNAYSPDLLKIEPSDDVHLSKLGYDIAVEKISEYLEEERILPK